MYKIVSVHEYQGGLECCVKYIHSKWGSPENYAYFYDAISNSSINGNTIPQFYVLVYQHQIVGCYGLIINDFISRHDLYPWLSSLFVEPEHRGKLLSKQMLNHGAKIAQSMGYSHLYLSTEHDGFYEKFGWQRLADGYELSGQQTRIYAKLLKDTNG